MVDTNKQGRNVRLDSAALAKATKEVEVGAALGKLAAELERALSEHSQEESGRKGLTSQASLYTSSA